MSEPTRASAAPECAQGYTDEDGVLIVCNRDDRHDGPHWDAIDGIEWEFVSRPRRESPDA
jgi:hypothetical protein